MVYQSKKDEEIKAQLDFENEKFKTVNMIYLTGPNKGKAFTITQSTLKRWWRKFEDNESIRKTILDSIDYEQVNTPYPEPKEQRYIPVPQSVIEYEESRSRRKKCDFEKPKDYEEFGDLLGSKNVVIKKVNSGYISLPDNSKLKLLSEGIGVLASEELGEKLVNRGLTCKACIEKGTPFRFDIKTQENFDILIEVLSDVRD